MFEEDRDFYLLQMKIMLSCAVFGLCLMFMVLVIFRVFSYQAPSIVFYCVLYMTIYNSAVVYFVLDQPRTVQLLNLFLPKSLKIDGMDNVNAIDALLINFFSVLIAALIYALYWA